MPQPAENQPPDEPLARIPMTSFTSAVFAPSSMLPCLFASSERVQHRITSGLIDGFSQWWQMPALVLGLAAVAVFVIWMYRRDAAELPPGMGLVLAALRLGALAALAAAYLDFERTAEHEIVFPSRVAVLVDSSASMTLRDDPAAEEQAADEQAADEQAADEQADTRSQRAIHVLRQGGLLTALAPRHEVSLWRFDADAEPLVVLPNATTAPLPSASGESPAAADPAPAAVR